MSSSGGEDDQAVQTFFVRALYDYEAQDPSSLSFIEGDVIEVLTQLPSGWWDGLLGEDRGWFPSNYVEAIDEDEAYESGMNDLDRTEDDEENDAALNGNEGQMQTGLEPALSLSTSTYPTNGDFSAPMGLTQDFERLRELMTHDHVGGDAFEQLAEAAMLDSHHGESNGEGAYRNGAAAAGGRPFDHTHVKRSSDIDLGSLHSGGGGASTPSSIKSPHTWAQTSGAGPSSASAARGVQSRPRAATGLNARRPAEEEVPFRDRAASDGTIAKAMQGSKESDYWVPKVTDTGEIVYYNTRTGKETSELPEGVDLSDSDDDEDARMSPIGRTVPAAEGSYFANLQRDGKPGLLSSNMGDSGVGRSLFSRPPGLIDDESETAELQSMLQPSEPLPLGQLLHRALERMVQLIDICEETVDSAGFSEADRHFAEDQPALLEKSGIRFSLARDRAISSIRNMLYCAGSLNVSRTDLLTVAELASLVTPAGSDRSAKGSVSPAESNQGAVAAFAGAVMAVHSKANDANLQFTPPMSVRGVAEKITATLAKLVLSSRAVTEQPPYIPTSTGTENGESAAQEDAGAAQRHTVKLNQYRQRVLDDAHELALLLEAFGNELEKHRALNSQPTWARRPFGALKSAEGTAGVSSRTLSGGSGAGWRGSGFVLPTPDETAAMRLQSMGHFKNPFDTTKDAQRLLISGKANLKRRPGQVLKEEFLKDVIVPQLNDALPILTRLMELVKPHLDSTSTGALTSSLGALAFEEASKSEEDDDDSLGLPSSTARKIIEGVMQFEQRFGSFMALCEDIDFASALDVDGPPLGSTKDAEVSLARSAKESLQGLISLKQSCYDSATSLVMDAQEVARVTSGYSIDSSALQRLFDTLETLKQVSSGMVESALGLAKIAKLQERETAASAAPAKTNVGARARVYGVEGAMNRASRFFSGQSEGGKPGVAPRIATRDALERGKPVGLPEDDEDVMYLGPGVAVPNGPSAGQIGPRDRAGSTATAVSSAAGSARKGGGRRPTQDEVSNAGTDDSPIRGNKLKKFFGDEEAQGSQQQPLSVQNEPLPPAPKKIVDESPWYLGPDYVPEDIVISTEGQVKGATLHALVARLTMHNSFDAPFNNTFLLTYRSFATTDELMNLLFARFRINPPEGLTPEQHSEWVTKKQMPVRLRVFNVLKSWLESYIYEGEDDRHLQTIARFSDEMFYHGMELPAKQLRTSLQKRAGGEGVTVRKLILPESAPPPVLPKTRNIKFLDIDALEMGRQLSLMDHGLYCKIKPAECLGKAWSNADSADRMAAGIKETISTSNQITGWVAESILVQQDLKKRAAWLKHFIAIADACRSLNNFSTMTAIVSGLNSAPVFRLKRTWDALNQRFIVMLEGMNKIMQSSKNFADYREMVHRLNPPCVPFLGVYLTDLTFIEDGNPDRLKSDERLINFGKRQKTAEVIREIMIYQATPYNLSVVPGVQRFIMANLISARNDNELYQQSLKLEPREREDEKISRLLAESGFL